MNAPRMFSALVASIMSLAVSTVLAGEWTARTFALKMSSRNAPAQACPEEANLDVKWVLNLSQPDDGTLDHVNPDRYYTPCVAGRDTPGSFVSRSLGDHQKDWDYIVAWRDRVWADRGIGPDAPIWEKVAAIAEAASATFDNRLDKSVKKDAVVTGEHAVDGIVKGTWCVGEANVMIAAASTMGLEGRSLGMGDHTVCEIKVDGKWRYVENIDSARPHCLSTRGFIEFLENPDCDPDMPARIGAFWKKRLGVSFVYGPGVGRYWQMKHQGGTFQVVITPENAHALYPSLTRIPTSMSTSLKSLNENHRGQQDGILKLSGVTPLKVGQNSGVRKSFYLSSVPASLSSDLFLDSSQTQAFPSNGGDWVIQVNGVEYPLRKLKGFSVDGEKLTIPIPISGLRAKAQNAVALRCTSAGGGHFYPKLYYDYLMPRPAFYYDPGITASVNSATQAGAARMRFPGAEWEVASPESEGVDSVKLEAAIDHMDATFGSDGGKELVIARNGRMIWAGPNSDTYHTIFSCTKTFTSTLLGVLTDDGKCSLDDPAVKYLPELDDQYPAYARIKLRHLAAMCGGYRGEVVDKRPDQPWGDVMAYFNPREPYFEAGANVQYNDHDVFVLGKILTFLVREPLQDFFQRRIAGPIGIKKWEWGVSGTVDGIALNNPPGNPGGLGAGGIKISPRDLARFGMLMLNRGNWNGRQLVSAAYVDAATSNQVPLTAGFRNHDFRGRYGFYWWTNGVMVDGRRPWPSAPPKTYMAHGNGGNFCCVVPEWGMVIARTGSGVNRADDAWEGFFGKLAPAISNPAEASGRRLGRDSRPAASRAVRTPPNRVAAVPQNAINPARRVGDWEIRRWAGLDVVADPRADSIHPAYTFRPQGFKFRCFRKEPAETLQPFFGDDDVYGTSSDIVQTPAGDLWLVGAGNWAPHSRVGAPQSRAYRFDAASKEWSRQFLSAEGAVNVDVFCEGPRLLQYQDEVHVYYAEKVSPGKFRLYRQLLVDGRSRGAAE